MSKPGGASGRALLATHGGDAVHSNAAHNATNDGVGQRKECATECGQHCDAENQEQAGNNVQRIVRHDGNPILQLRI
jgi:hypothetical protein